MKQVPILFMGDNPALTTGLGRIIKDLAVHVSSMPEFRVGTFGRGGVASSKLPFAQYVYDESRQWGEELLQGAWEDFAGNQPGVIMTIFDASRLDWFSQPRMGGPIQDFLSSERYQRWGYFAVDSYGIAGKLTGRVADTLR